MPYASLLLPIRAGLQLAEAIVLNYMALNGDKNSFESLFPTQNLGTGTELDEFIAFEAL